MSSWTGPARRRTWRRYGAEVRRANACPDQPGSATETRPPGVFDSPDNGGVFLTEVTRELVPTRRAGDQVVMDNLARHESPKVLRAIGAAGAHVLVLPPCSPDLNSIEQIFAMIKHRLRNAAARPREALWRAVGETLVDIEPQQCANCLRNAGFGSSFAGHALGSTLYIHAA